MQARRLNGLLQEQIAAYEVEIKNKWFRETGKKRAVAFKNRIAALQEREGLSGLQIAWRMFSYIEMQHGHGPLETSTDLRQHFIKALCNYLDIDVGKLERRACNHQVNVVRTQVNAIGLTGAGGAGACTYTLNDALLDVARIQLKDALTQKSLQSSRRPVTEGGFTSGLLETIREYQQSLHSNFCGGIKFGRRTGFKRANTLRDHISKDLCSTQMLTDAQIIHRMYEYCNMLDGQGPLDTSKELRSKIIDAMFKHFNLDMTPVYKTVNDRLLAAATIDTPGMASAGLSMALTAQRQYDVLKLEMIGKELRQGRAQQLQRDGDSDNIPLMRR